MAKVSEMGFIDKVMSDAFDRVQSTATISELVAEKITDFQRGVIAGKIEMLNMLARDFNPPVEDEDEVNNLR
jgi:hypothetical protein